MDTATLMTISGCAIAMVGCAIAIVATNIALIGWLRADMKSFEVKVEGWKEEIQKESKDFHGRLCAIEQKNKVTV